MCVKDKMEQEKPEVFIERAAPLTTEGIRAICGTDEEYKEFVEKHLGTKEVQKI